MSEIGNELRNGRSHGSPLIDDRIVQPACSDSAVRVRVHSGQVGRRLRPQG